VSTRPAGAIRRSYTPPLHEDCTRRRPAYCDLPCKSAPKEGKERACPDVHYGRVLFAKRTEKNGSPPASQQPRNRYRPPPGSDTSFTGTNDSAGQQMSPLGLCCAAGWVVTVCRGRRPYTLAPLQSTDGGSVTHESSCCRTQAHVRQRLGAMKLPQEVPSPGIPATSTWHVRAI
jgi:hypothetical protein